MQLQQWLVGLIVLACAAHAAWALMPEALRRRWAARWLGPELAPKTGGCGACAGCAGALPAARGPATSPAVKPLVFHPRPPR